ncbi:carboxypeptidase regulatory-like domain-containing protein [Streptomyces sp. SL13]|uniref:Carboxypeptidase regulatory-like domain-containing protein n=1 Tax=Streptantibioticus silvisoli TaxID=2705255 RepID=A0AA90GZZ2_9ACTN|nr:carboxypeptidase regulatory-like domain-containing protein [Streptantibioticus silvisoli]MDI5967787.1 carboxypeptidase regulatory-like domain-containing protein [Streptantibioticus silvisoli]
MPKGANGPARRALDRVLGSDPGLTRLRTALAGAVTMISTMALEYGYARTTHAGAQGTMIAIMLGAMLSMMGTMALTGSAAWPKIRTAAFFPVVLGAGMLVGVEVAGRTDLQLAMFVAVMFVAVYVRRFGMAFFFYGFMLWIGYFFASFLHATLAGLPTLLYDVALATAWVLLLMCTVLRTHPGRALRRVGRAFDARARAVAGACAALLESDPDDPWRMDRQRRRLHARQHRLAEAALIIEGWSAENGALSGPAAGPLLRRRLLDIHLTVDSLSAAAETLTAESGALITPAARILEAVARRDHDSAEALARLMLDADADADRDGPARHLAAAVVDYVALAERLPGAGAEDRADWSADEAADAEADAALLSAEAAVEFTPTLALNAGMLPGSAAVAGAVKARGHRWNPFSRLSLTTRQAIQVAIAATLAILAGRELNQTRYYWAVLATFIAFTGTATRSETTIKALNRVAGTLVGLGAGIGLAHLTAGHTLWTLAVIVVAMACGNYVVTVSYAGMVFCVTIMVSQLYGVLHELSAQLLLLRLEETALGAGIGIAVALVVVPTSTRDTVVTARRRYFAALSDLLTACATRMAAPTPGAADQQPPATDDALESLTRTLDHRFQQLALVARPLTRPLVWRNDPRLTRHRLTLLASTTRHSRALALAPRDPRRTVTDADLAAACRELAGVAGVLAEEPPARRHGRRRAVDVTARLEAADAALYAHRPQGGTSGAPPAGRRLAHLRQLLHELALAPGVSYAFPAGTGVLPAAAVPPAVPAAPARPAVAAGPAGARPTAHGLVRDGSGRPLARAALTIGDAQGREVARTATGQDGGFTVELPGPGTYVLSGAAEGHLSGAIPFAAEGRPVEIGLELSSFGGLTGVVRDAVTGAGVPGAFLTVTGSGQAEVCSGQSALDGGYHLDGLAAGRYALTVGARGYQAASSPFDMPVTEPGGSVWWEVRLAPAAWGYDPTAAPVGRQAYQGVQAPGEPPAVRGTRTGGGQHRLT